MHQISPEDDATARTMTPQQVSVLKTVRDTLARPKLLSVEWDVFAECLDIAAVEDLGGGYARITTRGRRLLRAYNAHRKSTRSKNAL